MSNFAVSVMKYHDPKPLMEKNSSLWLVAPERMRGRVGKVLPQAAEAGS